MKATHRGASLVGAGFAEVVEKNQPVDGDVVIRQVRGRCGTRTHDPLLVREVL